MIGLELSEALRQLEGKEVTITYNNSDKLANYDAQLVVDYKEVENRVYITVSNFKLKV